MWSVIKKNPISTLSVLIVTISGFFVGYMIVWQTSILTSPDWCKRAMGAEKVAPGQTYQQSLEALKSCNSSLILQLQAVGTDSHIDHTVIGLVLIFLIIVFVAGARASFKLSREGLEGNIARNDALPVTVVNPKNDPVQTAEVKPAAPSVPPVSQEPRGPAMPEPKP